MQDLVYLVLLLVTLAICLGLVEWLVRSEQPARSNRQPARPVSHNGRPGDHAEAGR